jgi:hypothetical protein
MKASMERRVINFLLQPLFNEEAGPAIKKQIKI